MAEFSAVLTKRKLDQLEDQTQFLSKKKIKAEKNSNEDVNISFFDLPHEIIHLILSFITNDTQRRHIRLVRQQWFDFINYSEFKIGLLLPSEVDEFSRCFGRYQKPIGLKFMNLDYLNYLDNRCMTMWKSGHRTAAPMFHSMLSSLTQLTALDLRLRDFEIPQGLINLQSLTVISPLYMDTISTRLTNLRRLETSNQLAQIPTTLESLDLSYKEISNIIIDRAYSRLTELTISTATRCEIPDVLTNLRKLSLYELDDIGSSINGLLRNSIQNCPNLEEIITDSELLPRQYPSTLTKLHLLYPESVVEITEDLTQLKYLECNEITLQHNSIQSLEDCVIYNPNCNVTILEHLNPLRVTKLCIEVVPQNIDLFSKFTNLVSLEMKLEKILDEAMVPLTRLTQLTLTSTSTFPHQWMAQLTNLVDLKLQKRDLPESINFETVHKLTSLDLTGGTYDSISILNLTNLMCLFIASENIYKTIEIHGLSTATNLTFLVCNNSRVKENLPLPPIQNFQELASLTKLRTLNFHRRNYTAFSDITVLTALQHLTYLEVRATSQSIWCLTKLTRLQKVNMKVDQRVNIGGIMESLPFCYNLEIRCP